MGDSKLADVRHALLNQQNEKIKYIHLISDPGFLQIELLVEKTEQKHIKLGYVERVIVRISDAIKRQRKILKNISIEELNISISNEKSVVRDLGKATSKENLPLMIELIEELNKKISQTEVIIRSI